MKKCQFSATERVKFKAEGMRKESGEAGRKEAGSWSEDGVPGGETHLRGSQAHSLGNSGLSGTSCAFRARGLASGARAVTSMDRAGLASGPWF